MANERQIPAPAVVIREARPGADDGAVAALMAEYLTWGNQRLREEYGIDEAPSDPAKTAASLAAYRAPAGALLVAEREGGLVGIAALRRLGPEFAEVKRMYVAPSARALHAGSGLLDRLLEIARGWGVGAVRLDTARFMAGAHRLYLSRGFVERPPYEGSEIPAHLQRHWRFFERTLRG